MPRLLLVDDNPVLLLDQVKHLFEPRGIEIDIARNGREGLARIADRPPDVVLLDVSMPELSGMEMYQALREIDARIPVIFITASSTTETAIEAMRSGAYDYLFKPVGLGQLDKVVTEAMELSRRMREPATIQETAGDGNGNGDAIVGRSGGMREVYKAIGRVTDQKVTVLITGESGTGKELIARAIYQHSGRADQPFLAINCAAIPESLLESEMFGHEKGAFTGADRRHIGKFEQCNGGTIFLDEIGDMPLATQAKILRLLEDQRFERVGGSETIQTDVRLIAATNQDLKALAGAGKFRRDLFYRLGVFTIHLPPLREREDDLPQLVRYYLSRFSRELGREVRDVSPEAMRQLMAGAWPGNVRELQSVLKQALLRSHGTVLLAEFLPDLIPNERYPTVASEILAPPSNATEPQRPTPAAVVGVTFDGFISERLNAGATELHAEAHLKLDRVLFRMVLQFASGNQLQASRILGISRQTLRKKLRELGLNLTKSVDEGVGSTDGSGGAAAAVAAVANDPGEMVN